MSRVPGWLGRLGAGLTEVSERLDERRAEVEREEVGAGPSPRPKRTPTAPRPPAAPRPRPAAKAPRAARHPGPGAPAARAPSGPRPPPT